MKIKQSKFVIFYIFNIVLLVVIVLLAIPFSKYLSRISLDDNSFVTGQVIVKPDSGPVEIINRAININLTAEVDKYLEWDFITKENKITINLGENKIIKYQGTNISWVRNFI